MSETLDLILQFLLLLVMQSVFINGLHIAFKGYTDANGKRHGNILFLLIAWRWENDERWIFKPLWTCVKCMSSIWGAVTFWSIVPQFYCSTWNTVFIFMFDVVCLTYLNAYFYKLV